MKINEMELAEFRKTLPDDVQQEWFRWLDTGYDVGTALFVIRKAELEQCFVNVELWCKALGMTYPLQEGKKQVFNILTGVRDEEALKDNINLEIPIIIVEHEFGHGKNKETTTIVIDGNKRLRKAFLQGKEKLQAYFIPKKLAKLCKL